MKCNSDMNGTRTERTNKENKNQENTKNTSNNFLNAKKEDWDINLQF